MSRSNIMDENVRIAIVGMLAPALIGAMAGIGAGMIKKGGRGGATRDEGFVGARVLAVVGITMAVFVALFGVYGMPGWPPVSSVDRLFLLPPGIGLVALAGVIVTAWFGRSSAGGERGLGWTLSCAAAAFGAAIGTVVALGPSFWNGKMSGMGGAAGLVWVPLVFGLWSAVSAWAIGKLVRPPVGAGKSAAVVLVGLCAAVGAGLLGTGSKDLGFDGFACAAAAAGLVVGLLVMRGSAGPGAIGVLCAMLGVLLACGVMLSSTPWWVVGVLGCVAPAAVVADVLIGRRLGKLGGGIVRLGAAVVVAAIAVGPGIWSLVKFVQETQSGH